VAERGRGIALLDVNMSDMGLVAAASAKLQFKLSDIGGVWGIAEQQKVQKQGRDDHKTIKYTNPLHIFFRLWKKIPVGGLYTCFM